MVQEDADEGESTREDLELVGLRPFLQGPVLPVREAIDVRPLRIQKIRHYPNRRAACHLECHPFPAKKLDGLQKYIVKKEENFENLITRNVFFCPYLIKTHREEVSFMEPAYALALDFLIHLPSPPNSHTSLSLKLQVKATLDFQNLYSKFY